MKRIIAKAQNLQQKAVNLRQAVQGLPGQAAKIREAVTMTGGELHQLRSEVQSSINALRVDNEERLLTTMREINDHAEVFAQAGYALAGLDLDLALNQRLAVHLDRVGQVPDATLQYLATRQSVESIRSILAGIIKAEETAANVELSVLQYLGVIIHVGPLPMIRLLWREPQGEEDPEVPSSEPAAFQTVTKPAAPAASTFTSNTPAYGSIFEPRPMPGRGEAGSASVVAPEAHIAASAPSSISKPALSGASWSSDALERFKRMPGASKYK